MDVVILLAYGLCLLFVLGFSLSQWHLTRLARQAYRQLPPPPAAPARWPRVTVQLPVYNELFVVERLIDAAVALDYPRELLHIQVLDDGTDESVSVAAARVAYHQQQGVAIDHVRRPSRTGFKAGALAYGLQHTDGELVAIFDADFVPPPDFLRCTVPHFAAADVGVVQTRWGHLNEGFSVLTRLQAFGLNAHFLVEQVGRAAGRHFLNFNGTGGVWRRTCIEDAGGWHADTLTEDLDLSYRAQLRGWRIQYLPHVVAPAELPAAMDAVKSQQFRWNKGGAETARKHLGQVLRAGVPLSTRLHAVFHLLNSSVFVALLLLALLSVPLLAVKHRSPALAPAFRLAAFTLLSFVPLLIFYYTAWQQLHPPQARSRWQFAGAFGLFIAVSLGFTLHNTRAVLQGLLGQSSAFIRTPKLGTLAPRQNWLQRRYRTGSIDGQTWLEGLLVLYFAFGLGLGLYLHDLGMWPFHLLLVVGYGIVFGYSLRHNRRTA